MQTLTSREVQNQYGSFVEAVQDDLVCVTRHGRPLFWALADRLVRSSDPAVLIGRLLLLNGQLNQDASAQPGDGFGKLLDGMEDDIDPTGITEDDVTKIVHEHRI